MTRRFALDHEYFRCRTFRPQSRIYTLQGRFAPIRNISVAGRFASIKNISVAGRFAPNQVFALPDGLRNQVFWGRFAPNRLVYVEPHRVRLCVCVAGMRPVLLLVDDENERACVGDNQTPMIACSIFIDTHTTGIIAPAAPRRIILRAVFFGAHGRCGNPLLRREGWTNRLYGADIRSRVRVGELILSSCWTYTVSIPRVKALLRVRG